MKTKCIIIFTINLCLIAIGNSIALDTNSVEYFPLNVGNIYVYDYSWSGWPGGGGGGIIKSRIIEDSIINNKKYFLCVGFPTFSSGWVRADSVSGSTYLYDSTNSCSYYSYEKLLDSLGASLNDTVRDCDPSDASFKCTFIGLGNIFGVSSTHKIFRYERVSSIYITDRKDFLRSIGLIHRQLNIVGGGGATIYYFYLKGCIINGKLYGDTTTVGINIISNSIPNNFFLHQNYPNPFNPVTKIKFEIPISSLVKLSVYNLGGKIIESIYEGDLNEGSYELDFDGSNYPSGIYFYILEANGYSFSRKMLLLK